MKYEKLLDMTEDELKTKESELKDQLFKLSFQHTLGQLENPLKMKSIKKDIARIKTLLTERSKVTE
jgi:large subunit ribosomal protein L29